jgi:hypothetical protein
VALIRDFPVNGLTAILERLRAAVGESLAILSPALAFFVGVLAADPSQATGLTVVYLFALAILNGFLAFGLTLVIISSAKSFRGWFAFGDEDDSAAGRAAFYSTAPAVVLAIVGICDLFVKLGFEEIFRAVAESGSVAFSNAAWTVFAVVGLLAVVAIVLGVRAGRSHYRRFLAEFDSSMKIHRRPEEWVSTTTTPRTRWTRGLALDAGLLSDRKYTEFRRMHPFLLLGNAFAALLLFVAAVVWYDHVFLRFLAPSLCALWFAGALRIHERLRALSVASAELDGGLVVRERSSQTFQYAAWMVSCRAMVPVALAAALAGLICGQVTGLLVAALVASGVASLVAEVEVASERALIVRVSSVVVGLTTAVLLVYTATFVDQVSPLIAPLLVAGLLGAWFTYGLFLRRPLTVASSQREADHS